MFSDLEVRIDPTDSTVYHWSARMMLGVGIANPGSVYTIPIEGEFRERLEVNATLAGMTFEDYVDKLVAEANAEEALLRA